MNLVKQSTQALEPITVDELKAHSYITNPGEDDYLRTLIAASIAQVEADTNRTLVDTTWRLTSAYFPVAIPLRRPPVAEVLSITYTDPDGQTQTLDASAYTVVHNTVGATVHRAPGTQWPQVQRDNPAAVVVEYRAGYVLSDGAGGTNGTLPVSAKHAALLWAAHLYEYRESIITGGAPHQLPSYAAMIAPLEVDIL